jgi:hypothetical protein
MRESNKSLDSTKFSQEKSITEYSIMYQSLKREFEAYQADKTEMIEKLNSLVDAGK